MLRRFALVIVLAGLPSFAAAVEPATENAAVIKSVNDLIAQIKELMQSQRESVAALQKEVAELRRDVQSLPRPVQLPTTALKPVPAGTVRFSNATGLPMTAVVNDGELITVLPGTSRDINVPSGPVQYQVMQVHMAPQRTELRSDEIRVFTLSNRP